MPVNQPRLSVIVILFEMRREAPRTLYSLSATYQRGVSDGDYEVIVIDNGSSRPMTRPEVESFGPNFRHVFYETASVSPVEALNHGVALASGEQVMVMCDGARMVSPGVLNRSLQAATAFAPKPTFVATLSWHLGPDVQQRSIRDGYDRDVEDALLSGIDWRSDGYELFRIATLAPSSEEGWFGLPAESNCVCLPKSEYVRMGGFETDFQTPGGGLANLDFFERALAQASMEYVLLLGEGSFHQVHGGISTNSLTNRWAEFELEYRWIRKRTYAKPRRSPVYFGHLPAQCTDFVHGKDEYAQVPRDETRAP